MTSSSPPDTGAGVRSDLDEKGWTAEVHKMVKAYGAPITAEDQAVVIAYLVKQYGKN